MKIPYGTILKWRKLPNADIWQSYVKEQGEPLYQIKHVAEGFEMFYRGEWFGTVGTLSRAKRLSEKHYITDEE